MYGRHHHAVSTTLACRIGAVDFEILHVVRSRLQAFFPCGLMTVWSIAPRTKRASVFSWRTHELLLM